MQKKAIENKDLEKQIADFSKYSTNEATAKAIAELQYYKNTIEKQTRIIEELKLQLEREKEINEKHQQELEKLQAEKLQAEKRQKKKRKNVLMLRRKKKRLKRKKRRKFN